METSTDTSTSTVERPTDREARAEHLHRRLQIERSAMDRALRELERPQPHPSIATMRAAYELARGDRAIADHEAGAA